MSRIGSPHHVKVGSEIDVVTLRQQVRQMARLLGLGLTQQARITAAISTVARSLVETSYNATFTIQATNHQPRPALEIVCTSSLMQQDAGNNPTHIKSIMRFDEAQSLVDEADISLQNEEICLTLRIWLVN